MSGTNYRSPVSKSLPALWLPAVALLSSVHEDLGAALSLPRLFPGSLQEQHVCKETFKSRDGDSPFQATHLPCSLNKHYTSQLHANI